MKSQVLRSLLWAVIVHVAWGALLVGLASLYDWATGAPPRQTGAPHNFPKNPFLLLAIFTISPCFAPFVYALIAVLLFIFFGRREAAKG